MFTETLSGKSISDIKEKSYVIELDMVVAQLSVSTVHNESSYVRTDESSVSMIAPDAAGADLLLPAFDAIRFSESPEQMADAARDTIETDAFDSIGKADLLGQRDDKGKCDSNLYPSDSAGIAEPFTERDGEAEAVVQSDETCKPDYHLIVYASARRSACSAKSNMNNDTLKSPRNYKRTSNKKTILNFTSLQISRRRRSLLATRSRSSVWGYMGNFLPDFKENSGLELNISKGRKLGRATGDQGIRKSTSNQKGKKSIGKPHTQPGPFSLKIKIGNQICSLVNVTKNFNASEIKLEEEVARDVVSPARKLEDVMSSDGSVSSTKFDVRDTVEKSCLGTSKDHQLIVNQFGETGSMNKGSCGPIDSLPFSVGEVREQYVPMRNAWVLCDDCEKWRRIPATLADQIEETNCGWTCKDNTDKDFADCSVSQEKSNAEINVELEISDASCEEDGCDASLNSNQNQSNVSQQSSWSLIKSNLFLHRSRKTQTVDEVMVCHCKPPSDGRLGCANKCLNRMLNIECVQGTCPCGELCSNQQFQKRKYAKLKWFRCGKKGYGLQALDDIPEGQFLIEYVGEVLDVHAYQSRQKQYASKGHKHFYFMTLNGSEVIDACAKGNLGRFINHSCDPNCRTEKWMVNGEVCVGLFAVKNVKKGEEVTFDYNYVRVFGAAAKKCVCGSLSCRGYIGGDPSNSEVIVQGDSDDEFSEPLMICEDKELNDDWNGLVESTEKAHSSKVLTQNVGGDIYASSQGCLTDAVRQLDMEEETGESMNRSSSAAFELQAEGIVSLKPYSVKFMKISLKSDGSMKSSGQNELSSAPNRVENSSCPAHGPEITTSAIHRKSLPDAEKSKSKLKYAAVGRRKDQGKAHSLTKTHHSSTSTKKGKVKSIVAGDKGTPNVDKSNVAPHKSDNLPELFLNNHFETVEEKLNELLDPEGGISKCKDASRGYLKLLLLTAASGNNGHGEAIQSNRDLSMILDALLKTKFRTVLVDVINKNGLQMLHNILKQCRREFIKTPILRKLLKILEYMATREILKLEHITGGPPRPGVESFKDSILTLTEHTDKQVHQSARSFRDKWIPRSLRKNSCTERVDARMEYPQLSSHDRLSMSHDIWSNQGGKLSEATNCRIEQPIAASCTIDLSGSEPISASVSSVTDLTKTRKRKSRWDNPADERPNPSLRANMECDGKLNADDDIPPGFSSPCNGPMVPSDPSSTPINRQEREASIKQPYDTVLGDSQQIYNAHMSTSYGIPSSVMQQFGVCAETSDGWTLAPGVHFHPFPPLPPYPVSNLHPPSCTAVSPSLCESEEKTEQDSLKYVARHSDKKHSKTPNVDSPEMNISCANGRHDFMLGGNSYSMGRKYFQQQKWNNSKVMPPPWIRMRNGW